MKTKVIEVKQAPNMTNPNIQQGIRDKTAAQNWGEKNGHAFVYYLPRKQKVYAERLLQKVDEQAQEIEQKSEQLLMFAESAL